jgi:hypothetical protein
MLAPFGVVVRDCASFGLTGVTRVAVPSEVGLERLEAALAWAGVGIGDGELLRSGSEPEPEPEREPVP